MTENASNEDNILVYKSKKSDIKNLILDPNHPIKKYIDYANNEKIFLKRTITPFEKYFMDILSELVTNSEDSSILKFLSQYELRHQIHWLVIIKDREQSQIVFWDYALHNTKTDKDEIFIELDDGSHHKPNEDEYILVDNDDFKNKCIKRFGYYLIRIKAANYMYGFNDMKSLSESDSISEDDADSKRYEVNCIEPYGKKLLIDHLTTCLQTALEHKVEVNRGEYICCPDGYKIKGLDVEDNFSESTHKTTYRTDIFCFGNDFQFKKEYMENE